ncbi:MAG: c-type cytochrome [Proteobacteria bacterium]|uniref:c-type cytochrome n=1 Tax=Rudaea sp. TaxID=2136325 RepID=UPI00322009CF|nr:c-type cytochrome [Pseudomonadota bacterium]
MKTAAKRAHRLDRTASPRAIATLLLACAGANASAADFLDQRRVEPIQGDVAAGAAKAVVCVACHGPNGNAIVPTFPKLAGQRAEYLHSRLSEYKHADAKLPYYAASPMPVQAQALSEADMHNLAAYFAAQKPMPSPTAANTPPGETRGERLYREGDSARGIPPCQGCHGANAEGGPVAAGDQYLVYPALRGQHAPYLSARLSNYRAGWPYRASGDYIMAGVARTLDDESIQAVAAWLAALPPQEQH